MPDRDKKCIDSWKQFCPDYEIIRWDENNYDVTKNQYMYQAYEAKKWGFVPDYARLDIVYENGGIYLDTDVELIRSLDDLLDNHAFMGFEAGSMAVAPGLGFGAEAKMPLMKELMYSLYSDRNFKNEDNIFDTTPNPTLTTEYLIEKGLKYENKLQIIEDMTIYPTEYFCPINFDTNILTVTSNTHSIHHYHASWLEPEEKKMLRISQNLAAKYGKAKADLLMRYLFKPYRLKMHLRTKGVKGTLNLIMKKF